MNLLAAMHRAAAAWVAGQRRVEKRNLAKRLLRLERIEADIQERWDKYQAESEQLYADWRELNLPPRPVNPLYTITEMAEARAVRVADFARRWAEYEQRWRAGRIEAVWTPLAAPRESGTERKALRELEVCRVMERGYSESEARKVVAGELRARRASDRACRWTLPANHREQELWHAGYPVGVAYESEVEMVRG